MGPGTGCDPGVRSYRKGRDTNMLSLGEESERGTPVSRDSGPELGREAGQLRVECDIT